MPYPSPYDKFIAPDPIQDAMIANKAAFNRPRFDFNDQGPAMMERNIAAKMLQDRAQTQAGQRLSMPLTTGEMIPSIGTAPSRPEVAPQSAAPTNLTLNSNRREAMGQPFDTATTGRLRNVPGAYEEALASRVQQMPMTATIGGKEFTAQPAPRMDRRAMEQMIARKMLEEQQRKEQVQIDDARKFEMDKARIPGENAIGLAEVQGGIKERLAQLQAELDQPITELKRKQIKAEIASIKQRREQEAQTFENTQTDRTRNLDIAGTPEQQRADALYEKLAIDPIANRAALQALLPRTSFGGVAADVPEVAQNMFQQTPQQAQSVISSNPMIQSQLESLSAFTKKLSGESTFGVNTITDESLASFKTMYDDTVAQLVQNNIAPEQAQQIVQSQIKAVLPPEVTPSVFSQIFGDIAGAFNPFRGLADLTSGRPGTPAQDLRRAAGL